MTLVINIVGGPSIRISSKAEILSFNPSIIRKTKIVFDRKWTTIFPL
jgi:hypothetical protein